MDVNEAIGVMLIFFGMASPALIVFFFWYLKKRLEHKQIMAAIERGVSFPEINPAKPVGPSWIKNLTGGIAFLVMTAGIIFIALLCRDRFDDLEDLSGYFIIAVILFAVGISRLIRGLWQRKFEKQYRMINTN